MALGDTDPQNADPQNVDPRGGSPRPTPPMGPPVPVPGASVGAPDGGPGLLVLNLKYFAIRAALFGAVLAAVLVLGVDGLLAFAVALVVSGLASYPLAVRQRRAVLDRVEARRGGRPR